MKRYLLIALLGAVPAAQAALSDFEAMDQDRDERVTAAEMTAAQRALAGAGATSRPMSSEEKIKVVDTDGDGILSATEHEDGSRAMFAKMDGNKDGFLTREEWSAGHAALGKK